MKPPEVVERFSRARWKGLEVPRRIGGAAMVVPKPIRGRTRKTAKIRGMQISGIRRSKKVFYRVRSKALEVLKLMKVI